MMPIALSVDTKFEPPALIKGRAFPANGMSPTIIRAGKSNLFLSSLFTKTFVNASAYRSYVCTKTIIPFK